MAAKEPQDIVGIFWDIQNCAVPHGKSASKVVKRIRSMPFCQGKSEMQFLVVCDVTKELPEVIQDLNLAQVDVQHVASAAKKNAADEKLKLSLRRFIDIHTNLGAKSITVVLVSGDLDFLADITDAKVRCGVYVVLLHNRNTSDVLVEAAHESHDFHTMLSDLPIKKPTQTPFQFTELEVSNIPSCNEMSTMEVEKKLETAARAFHGKVKYIGEKEGTAVLKFESGDKTQRALKVLQGHVIGNRKIRLDYNRRSNFINAKASSKSPNMPRRPVAAVAAFRATKSASSLTQSSSLKMFPVPMREKQLSSSDDSEISFPDLSEDVDYNFNMEEQSDEGNDDKVVMVIEFPNFGKADGLDTIEDFMRTILERQSIDFEGDISFSTTDHNLESRIVVFNCDSGMKLLDLMNGMPFRNAYLKVSFLNPKHEMEGKIRQILLKTPQMSMALSRVVETYFAWYDEFIDEDKVFRNCKSIVMQRNKDDDEVILKIQPCSSPTKLNCSVASMVGNLSLGSSDIPRLCSTHDGGRFYSTDFILPNVITTLREMRRRLELALNAHPYGIPLESLPHCLESCSNPAKSDELQFSVVKRDKGVSLEMLLAKVDITEILEEDKEVPLLIRRRQSKLTSGKKSLKSFELQRFQSKLLEVLQSVPQYRINKTNELARRYAACHGRSIEEDSEQFGGFDEALSQLKDTFLILGRGSQSELTVSPQYIKTVFILALRKILTALPYENRYINRKNQANFEKLFRVCLKKKFQASNFGLCFLTDLFEDCFSSKQNILRIDGDFISLAGPIETFVSRTLAILRERDGFSCTLVSFDEEYVKRFGIYSIPDLSYKSFDGLVNEFKNELEMVEGLDRGPKILKMSKAFMIKTICSWIMEIVEESPGESVKLFVLPHAYLLKFKKDLHKDLGFLGDTDDPVEQFITEHLCSEREGEVIFRNETIFLVEGAQILSFIRKSIALLFHRGSNYEMECQKEFPYVFAKIFGENAFCDIDILKEIKMLKTWHQPPIEVATDARGCQKFQLSSHCITLCKIVVLLSQSHSPLTLSIISEQFRSRFGEDIDLNGYGSLISFCNSFPYFFSIHSGDRIGLNAGGQIYKKLDINSSLVHFALESYRRERKSKNESAQKLRRSRLAANFNQN